MEGVQEPLWGQWYLGECLYSSGPTQVYALNRRGEQGRACVVKCLRVAAEQPGELERVQALCRVQERMADSGYAVALLDDMVLPVSRPDGALSHYLLLLRLERLDCLAELLREGAVFSEEQVLALARDLCAALVFAARLGIVHRDIKPANIYRAPSGHFKLGDFGIAERPTEAGSGSPAGTAAYLAPEALTGGGSAQADLYALGIVLYQLLNRNHLPLTAEASAYTEVQQAIAARLNGAKLPPPPAKSLRLRYIVAKACQAQPRRRWASAGQMLAALNGIPRLARRLLAGACGLCLALGLALGLTLAPGGGRAAPETAVTEATAHRYQVVQQVLDWDDARIWCESRGGHLAVITSREEAEYITTLLGEAGLTAAWLGADNRNPTMGFQWLTGEAFAYAEWGVGEPNNSNGIEYYLMIQYKEEQGWVWNDSRLDGLSVFAPNTCGFVCEWEEEATP